MSLIFNKINYNCYINANCLYYIAQTTIFAALKKNVNTF